MTPKLSLVINALGLVLVAETLPLLLEMLILSLAAALPLHRRKPVPPRQAIRPMKLAVIIPAHNEEHLIGECVRSLIGPAHEKRQSSVVLYVVAHNCVDDTEGRAKAAGAEVLPFTNSIGGKAMALDFGFRRAIELGADAVLVVDANSVAGPGLIQRAGEAFASGVQAVQCRSQVASGHADVSTRVRALTLAGVSLVRPLGRARIGLSCGLLGNGFGVTAATLAQVPYPLTSLEETVEYHLQLVRTKVRVEFLNDVSVFSEMPLPPSAASSRHAIGEGCKLLMRRLWSGPLLRGILCGRVAQLEPLIDLLALPLAVEIALFLLMFLLGQGVGSGWLARYAGLGLFSCGLYLVTADMLLPTRSRAGRTLLAAPASFLRRLSGRSKQSTESHKDRWVVQEGKVGEQRSG